MITFLIAASLLTTLALMFVLPTLLREDFQWARDLSQNEMNLAILRGQMKELNADLSNGTLTQFEYEDSMRELARRLAEEMSINEEGKASSKRNAWEAICVACFIPTVAALLYFLLGTPIGFGL